MPIDLAPYLKAAQDADNEVKQITKEIQNALVSFHAGMGTKPKANLRVRLSKARAKAKSANALYLNLIDANKSFLKNVKKPIMDRSAFNALDVLEQATVIKAGITVIDQK